MPLAINNISCSNASPNPLEENDDIPSSSYKACLLYTSDAADE